MSLLLLSSSVMWCRYLIKYSVSDFSGAAAAPVTIDVTFVEVALVTGSFLFLAQADSIDHAQQHAAQLCTAGSDINSVLTADIGTVLQTWLASATSMYVRQMTTHLGADAYAVAAVNMLELGLFSAVLPADVTVMSASIDRSNTVALNTDSSSATQNYAFNVTVQVAVLTSNMLKSVYVGVLSDLAGLSSPSSRRRLHSRSHSKLSAALLHSSESALSMQTTSDHVAASNGFYKDMAALHFRGTSQQTDSKTARASGFVTAREDLHGQLRSLLGTSLDSQFPLASLLAFKSNLVLAAFDGTTGCDTDGLTALFYKDSNAPAGFSDLCVGDGSAAGYSMNAALLASVNASVPLFQVSYAGACTDCCNCTSVLPKPPLALWPLIVPIMAVAKQAHARHQHRSMVNQSRVAAAQPAALHQSVYSASSAPVWLWTEA